MSGSVSAEGVLGIMARAIGDSRSDADIALDGAKVAVSQIQKLRNALDRCEADAQRVIATGKPLPDSEKIWKRADKAACKLFAGMI